MIFDMDDVARENDMGETSLTPENKVDTIMNVQSSQETGSMNQDQNQLLGRRHSFGTT